MSKKLLQLNIENINGCDYNETNELNFSIN